MEGQQGNVMASESTYTKTPNFIFEIMPQLSPAEFKVIMVVVRQTFGFHKERDAISLSQFMSMTSLSRQGVINAIASLIEKGFIVKHTIGNTFKYSVNIVNSVDQSTQLTSQLSLPELVNSVDYLVNSVDHLDPKLVNSVDLQKKGSKENNTKEKKIVASTSQPSKSDLNEKAMQAEAPNPTKAILDAYIEVRGRNGIEYGKEGKAAKKIATAGYTVELVKGCYLWLKQDKFWEFKPVSLAVVYQNLPEYQNYLEKRAPPSQAKPKQRYIVKRADGTQYEVES